MTGATIVLILTTISVSLITGLWYAYSCSVNIGLHRLPDNQYLAAMQSINREILNPVFFATFLGTAVLLPFCSYVCYERLSTGQWALLFIATLMYVGGVFGVTIFGNVPLNESLDKFNLGIASASEIKFQRLKFEMPWNRLHTIRTAASLIALVLTIVTCINYSGK